MIPFNKPYKTGREAEYIQQVLDGDHFSGNGPFTVRCQELLETRYGFHKVLLTHSATGALEMMPLLLELGPGDEVILPSYTFPSTAAAFLRAGVGIVFCEVDPATMNMDVADACSRVTERTRAVVPVHYGGIAVDLDALRAGLPDRVHILEDAAQGLHARHRGRPLGSFGPLGALSFHETKNIHCGLGGALLVNDPQLVERAEDIWERGTDRGKMFRGLVDKYSWVELGSSFYPTELQSAFLLAQLEAIEENSRHRERIYHRYRDRLAPLQGDVFTLPMVPDLEEINFHSFFLIADSEATADAIREELGARKIAAYIGYVPLHSSRMGVRLGYQAEDLPVTEEYAFRVVRLPFHNSMDEDDVDQVCDALATFLRESRSGV